MPASLFTLVLVVVIHASALGFVFYASGAKEPEIVELPRVQGILLPAPAAEEVAIPSAPQQQPIEEQPVIQPPEVIKPPEPKQETKPEPKQEPKPEPKPTPEPALKKPELEPVVKQPEPALAPEQPAPSEPLEAAPAAALPLANDADSLGAPITPPQEDAAHLNNPRPAYPNLSKRLREEGTVVLDVLILVDGSVGDVVIKESSGFKRLDETAVKAVRQWRYLPARRGDQPVESWHLQPIEFSLR